MPHNIQIRELQERIAALEQENIFLRRGITQFRKRGKTVTVPKEFEEIFRKAEETVGKYFTGINIRPSEGTLEIGDERYVLVRASALSYEFFNKIKDLYADRGEEEAVIIGKNFLFDIGHVIGIEDARNFHQRMNLVDPVAKLSAGPVHFAYTGWAYVDILPESNAGPGDEFYMKYHHPYSFEADSWIKTGKKSTSSVCIMNAAYSSGWCEESFGIPLTAVEISCRAKGDEHCTFIMAPPHKIHEYLSREENLNTHNGSYDVPMFFERKKAEEQIKASLQEKEMLLKEIHHRVKNNLQIISSLLKLQSGYINDKKLMSVLESSQDRIKTMAIVHEKLYQSDLQYVNFGGYIRSIAQLAYNSFSGNSRNIKFTFDFTQQEINFKIDLAIPCGLIVNEIITNAFKYAFDDKEDGVVHIRLMTGNPGEIILSIHDNGKGLPEHIDPEFASSFGFELIRLLIMQIDGKMETHRENGTKYVLHIPYNEKF